MARKIITENCHKYSINLISPQVRKTGTTKVIFSDLLSIENLFLIKSTKGALGCLLH